MENMEETNRESGGSSLREEYYQARQQPIPKRAKGTAYVNIIGPCAFIGMGLVVITCIKFSGTPYDESLLMWVIMLIELWLFWYTIPENLADRKKRTKRYSLKRFPALRNPIEALRRHDNGEVCSYDLPVFWVNGQRLFLMSYLIRQKWWELTPSVKISGWVLMDEEGRVIKSNEFFAKTFATTMHMIVGGTGYQNMDVTHEQALKSLINLYVPRAVKVIRWNKWQFKHAGQLESWDVLNKRLPELQTAMKETYSIHLVNKQIQKAIGYSFGYEFYYEDAVIHEKINRSFSRYIAGDYSIVIAEIRQALDQMETSAKRSILWAFRPITKWAFSTIRKSMETIRSRAIQYRYEGIPSEGEWLCYVERMKYAESLGYPTVQIGEYGEAYPWKDAIYHDDFLKPAGEKANQ